MKEVKTFAVPIGIADTDNDENFKLQAEKLGFVWSSGDLGKMLKNKNFQLYGLVMKTLTT